MWCSVTGWRGGGLGFGVWVAVCGGLVCVGGGLGRSGGWRWVTQRHPLGRSSGMG